MFRFENPQYLYLLVLVPAFILLYVWGHYRKRRRLKAYGDPQLLRGLMRDVSKWRPLVKFALLMVALASLVIAFARPQYGTKINTAERNGIEAMIAVDVSNSMLAEDVRPSRLDKAKMLFSNMVDNMKNDHVGIVVFAGEAYTKLPITNDYVSTKLVLEQMDPSMVASQGTDVAAAIELAEQNFSQREDVTRAIFLITDGEDNEGGAVKAAKKAAERGVKVFVLGVGSPQGAHIPMPGTHENMVDDEGMPVVTALNEEMCAEIAKAGEGAYIYVENSTSAQAQLNKYLDKLQKTNLEKNVYSEYDEQFQGFLIIALVCLLLEVLLLERETYLFSRRKTATFVLCLLCSATMMAQSSRDYVRRGNRQYQKNIYEKALVEYKNAYQKDSTDLVVLYNYANSLLQLGDSTSIKEANNLLLRASKMAQTPNRKARIHLNLGWLYQSIHREVKRTGREMKDFPSQKLLEIAISNYKEALRNAPNDAETRYNYVLCQRQLKKEQQQGGKGESQQQAQQTQDQQKKDEQQDKKEQPDNPEQNPDKQAEPQNKDKRNAEQLLKAALQNERKTQDKVKQQQQTDKRRLKKQW